MFMFYDYAFWAFKSRQLTESLTMMLFFLISGMINIIRHHVFGLQDMMRFVSVYVYMYLNVINDNKMLNYNN